MGRKIELRRALDADRGPLIAPPDWKNTEVAVVMAPRCFTPERVVSMDAGIGEAILISADERHRAVVARGCLLLSVEAVGMKRSEP